MRKLPLVAILTLLLIVTAAALSPLMLRAAPPQAEDMPNRTARAFAPFIRAVVMRRLNTAQQIFKSRRSVQSSLEQPESVRIIGHFQKPDRFELNLIGGRTMGHNIGILLFTTATEEGPVFFKIYFSGFNNEVYIDRIELGDDWDTLEEHCRDLDMLPSPVTVPLAGGEEGPGGG